MSRVVYGKRPVYEILEAGTPPLQKIALAKGLDKKEAEKITQAAREKGVSLEWVDRRWLDAQCQGGNHQGIAAFAPDFAYAHLSEVLRKAKPESLLVVLDQVTDPHNLGAIIRSADATGCMAVVIPKDHAAQVTPVAEKASAGACAHVPVASITNLSQALEEIKQAGFWCYGLSGNAKARLDDEKLGGKVCLVMGSEGKGMRPLVAKHCDKVLNLRMRGRVDSFNVSVAAGISLYLAAGKVFQGSGAVK